MCQNDKLVEFGVCVVCPVAGTDAPMKLSGAIKVIIVGFADPPNCRRCAITARGSSRVSVPLGRRLRRPLIGINSDRKKISRLYA